MMEEVKPQYKKKVDTKKIIQKLRRYISGRNTVKACLKKYFKK